MAIRKKKGLHLLAGCLAVADRCFPESFDDWLESSNDPSIDIQHNAWLFLEYMKELGRYSDRELVIDKIKKSETRKDGTMPVKKKAAKKKTAKRKPVRGGRSLSAGSSFKLPTTRSQPVGNPWEYAYLITGEKKIGKTTLAVQGCEEFIIQFDKPSQSLEVFEETVNDWRHFKKVLKALEDAASSDSFPYQRVIIDGVGEWYQMCMEYCCKELGITHPSEAEWGKGWSKLKQTFTDAVNRLLRLQATAKAGIVFIAHAEWKEQKLKGGETIDKFVPNLPGSCEEIVNGKVDAWFVYDYDGSDRVMIVQGSDEIGAGHRIDGRFMTIDGRRVEEIYMGTTPQEAMTNLLAAFNNKLDYVNMKEYRKKHTKASPSQKTKKKVAKKAAKKKTAKRRSA